MRQSNDFSLYLVTDRSGLNCEEFIKVIQSAIEGGVRVVQLREKETSARDVFVLGKKLLTILKPLRIPLIINDRVDIALALNADGVHLGQSDLSVVHARGLLGKKAIIGLSVESLEQALEAEREEIDYLAASPIFNTKTKTDTGKPWGLVGLKELCSRSPHPVLAIGGVNEANVHEMFECGAKGVAVVSAIFKATCPKSAAIAINNRIKTCIKSSR